MPSPQAYFLTGTDTEVGKTYAACALLYAARALGLTTLAMKPVAAGVDEHGRNSDVESLIAASSVKAERGLINPCLLKAPIAPHIAASEEGLRIDIDTLAGAYRTIASQAEFVVVEGVGGFRVPLDEHSDAADLAQALALPVLLVVGLRLGCINHALLTAEAIRARQLRIAGWIANRIDPSMMRWSENVAALESRLDAPLLGLLPWQAPADPRLAAANLKLP